MVDPEIMEAFLAESAEHLATVEDEILALERGDADPETINHLFRALHTVKGASSFIGLQKITDLSHALENVVGKVRAGTLGPTDAMVDALLKGVDRLKGLLEQPEDSPLTIAEEVVALEAVLAAGQPPAAQVAAPAPAKPRPRTKAKAKTRAREPAPAAADPSEPPPAQGGEPAAPPPRPGRPVPRGAPPPPAAPPPDASSTRPEPAPTDSTVRISLALLDKLMNLASELVLVRNQNMQAVNSGDVEQLTAIAQRLNVVTSDLQASVMQTRMRPVGTVFGKFTRFARDFARKVNKEIDLEIVGADVELDKSIIESIGDPLTHLIRNAVDHGIEDRAGREALGKTPRGQIRLSAFHQAGLVNIQIQDDGQGMDPQALKQAALRKGLINQEQAEAMADRDAFNLIFTPGFSMARTVTDVSGRGVGMDVVKATFKKLGGVIEIASQPDEGTTFTVKLPLTLAIVPTLIVAVEDSCFAIPQVNIDEVVWLHGDDVYQSLKRVDDQEVYWLRGKLLPILRLSKVLELPKTFVGDAGARQPDPRAATPDQRAEAAPVAAEQRGGPAERRTSGANSMYIVVLKLGNEQFGLLVDDIVDTEEIVVKSLHDQLKSGGAFAGTTVLGDGRIAMILDVAALAELGALHFSKLDDTVATVRSSAQDRQTLLIFNLGGEETFAVPLSLIARVEEIPPSRIQLAREREYLDFRDALIPLVRIEQAMSDVTHAYGEDLLYVIIPKADRTIGVLAAEILDTVEVDCQVDAATISRTGIVGSTLLDGNLTLFLDLFTVIDAVEPGWFRDNTPAATARRVLLLEDSSFYAALIVPYLQSAGLEVVHVENGAEGLARLGESSFDIVVSDIEMPVMNGLEFAERVRSDHRFRDLPLLAISAMTDPGLADSTASAGFNRFQSKQDQGRMLEVLMDLCTGRAST